ncbi:MAG: endonuclease/exonuclease/phosphatase family protein [Saprospiraceae bacterium]|nr:endonuclease/exonuclease/phosphatase family protein [Saprospiraceae bacterium]
MGAFPYRLRSSLTTVAIFSRFPIVGQQNLKLEPVNGSNGCEWADIKINDKIIRLYNLHLQSNSVSGLADDLVENGNFDEKSTWAKIARMIKRFRSNTLIRAKQAEIIAAHVKKSPHPILICGDLNDIPISYTYTTICDNLQDGFKKAGSGFSTTYAGNVPALKIDYILADNAFFFEDFDIKNVAFSDHFPVVARIKMP